MTYIFIATDIRNFFVYIGFELYFIINKTTFPYFIYLFCVRQIFSIFRSLAFEDSQTWKTDKKIIQTNSTLCCESIDCQTEVSTNTLNKEDVRVCVVRNLYSYLANVLFLSQISFAWSIREKGQDKQFTFAIFVLPFSCLGFFLTEPVFCTMSKWYRYPCLKSNLFSWMKDGNTKRQNTFC